MKKWTCSTLPGDITLSNLFNKFHNGLIDFFLLLLLSQSSKENGAAEYTSVAGAANGEWLPEGRSLVNVVEIRVV